MKHVKHYKRSFDRNHSISDRKRFLPDKTCERNPFIGKRTEARYIAYLLPMEQTILSTRGGGRGKTRYRRYSIHFDRNFDTFYQRIFWKKETMFSIQFSLLKINQYRIFPLYLIILMVHYFTSTTLYDS